ncbi:hypothetical protein ACTXT7_015350 [Hymenolepis weldensis]
MDKIILASHWPIFCVHVVLIGPDAGFRGKRTAVNIVSTDEQSDGDPRIFPELDNIDLIP